LRSLAVGHRKEWNTIPLFRIFRLVLLTSRLAMRSSRLLSTGPDDILHLSTTHQSLLLTLKQLEHSVRPSRFQLEESMRAFLSLGLLASTFTFPAWTAAFNININEFIAHPTTPAGLVGRLQSGNLVLCDAFNVGTTICTGNNISDLVQWAGGSISLFASG